ncbi:MAG: hypothetical protein QXV17_02785 [Candidatus Micrarchaeaceae archaeon]
MDRLEAWILALFTLSLAELWAWSATCTLVPLWSLSIYTFIIGLTTYILYRGGSRERPRTHRHKDKR